MEILLYSLIAVLVYKLLMPFVALIVKGTGMNDAAKYIERTERGLPTKEIVKTIAERMKNKGSNKKP
jgi:hypothetical protein